MRSATDLRFGKREVHDWISRRSGLVWVEDFCGIARYVDNQIVAAIGYDHHQGSSCSFHLATEPHGLTRELLWRAFQVPFIQWDYKVLLGIIQFGNTPSLNIARRLGFTKWTTLPGAHPSGSLEFFQMDRASCPWLDKTRIKNVRRRRTPESTRSLVRDEPSQLNLRYGDEFGGTDRSDCSGV